MGSAGMIRETPPLPRREQAIAATLLGERREQLGRVGILALADQRQGGRIAPGLGAPLRSLVLAPRDDRAGDGHGEHGDEEYVFAVARPELEEVFATQLLVDFAEDVAHKRPGSPGRRPLPYPLGRGDANRVVLRFAAAATGRTVFVALLLRAPFETAGRLQRNG